MKWDILLTDFRIVILSAFLKNVLTLSMDVPGDRPSTEIMFLALLEQQRKTMPISANLLFSRLLTLLTATEWPKG